MNAKMTPIDDSQPKENLNRMEFPKKAMSFNYKMWKGIIQKHKVSPIDTVHPTIHYTYGFFPFLHSFIGFVLHATARHPSLRCMKKARYIWYSIIIYYILYRRWTVYFLIFPFKYIMCVCVHYAIWDARVHVQMRSVCACDCLLPIPAKGRTNITSKTGKCEKVKNVRGRSRKLFPCHVYAIWYGSM